MQQEVHPYSKEVDEPIREEDVDDRLSDSAVSPGESQYKLFGKVLGALIVIAVNLGVFVLINFSYDRIPFLTDEFSKWLPYANVAIVVGVVTQLLLLFLAESVFKPLIEAFSNLVSLIATFALLLIYPFNFEALQWFKPMDTIAKVVLILVIIALIIGFIANLVTFFTKLFKFK